MSAIQFPPLARVWLYDYSLVFFSLDRFFYQGASALAVGYRAGYTGQGSLGVGIGQDSAYYYQGTRAVGMGYQAAYSGQGAYSVAIGEQSGRTNQGPNSVAIGRYAGFTGQHNNSVIISGLGATELNSDRANALFMAPIRNTGTSNLLYYNSTSKEVSYSPTPAAVCILSENTNQSIPIGVATPTALTYSAGAVISDPLGFFNAGVSTTQIKPTLPGYYMVIATNTIGAGTSSYYRQRSITVNAGSNGIGVADGDSTSLTSLGNGLTSQVSFFGYFNGTTDYFETGVSQGSGSSQDASTKNVYCYKVA